MHRVALLLLVVTGCLDAPTAASDAGPDVAGDGGGDGGLCATHVQDDFNGDGVDPGTWMPETFLDGTVDVDNGLLVAFSAGPESDWSEAAVVSRDERVLAGTHLLASVVVYNNDTGSGDATVSWFGEAFVDYYAIVVRPGVIDAVYSHVTDGATSLCPSNDCPPYGDGSVLHARMSATEATVQMSVAVDGGPWFDFEPAPNIGHAYAVKLGSVAFPNNSVELRVDDVIWNDCPLDE